MDPANERLYKSNMRALPPGNRIPSYNLYGERDELPDVLHCETIEARAVRHDWHISAHRHAHMHQFLLVRSGGGVARLDDEQLALRPATVINVPCRAIHGFDFEPYTGGWVVTVPVSMLEPASPAFSAVSGALARPGHATGTPALAALFESLAAEHAGLAFGRASALQAAAHLLATHVARLMQAGGAEAVPGGGAGMLHCFETLVEQRFRERWRIADYAAALGMSATHLTRLANAGAGLSASALVEARIVREARRELAYTNLSIARIAYDLGYEDPAYFSRVFSRATGLSPSQYRARCNGGGAPAQPD